jgi:hypothetical protein
MAERIPPSGQEDPGEGSEDILGKLDLLLHKHRPQPADAHPALPVLSDALQPEAKPPPEDSIPTLTDIVGKPARSASFRRTARVPDAGLETRLIYALAAALEAKQVHLASAGASDPALIQALDELIAELKRALPAIVRSALSGG